jgi:hypothetical protein
VEKVLTSPAPLFEEEQRFLSTFPGAMQALAWLGFGTGALWILSIVLMGTASWTFKIAAVAVVAVVIGLDFLLLRHFVWRLRIIVRVHRECIEIKHPRHYRLLPADKLSGPSIDKMPFLARTLASLGVGSGFGRDPQGEWFNITGGHMVFVTIGGARVGIGTNRPTELLLAIAKMSPASTGP